MEQDRVSLGNALGSKKERKTLTQFFVKGGGVLDFMGPVQNSI